MPAIETLTSAQQAAIREGIGAVGRVLLDSLDLSGLATGTFTGIPQTSRDLLIVLEGRCVAATTAEDIRMRFNGDASGVYDRVRALLYSAGPIADAGENETAAYFASINGASSPADLFGYAEGMVPNYASAATFQNWRSSGHCDRSGTGATFIRNEWSGVWKTKAAITSITLYTNGGSNFAAGSYARLYGLG